MKERERYLFLDGGQVRLDSLHVGYEYGVLLFVLADAPLQVGDHLQTATDSGRAWQVHMPWTRGYYFTRSIGLHYRHY